MSGNGSTSSIEDTSTRQDEVSSRAGILHRLGTFLRGITSRCRRRVERVRNRQKRRTNGGQAPENGGQKESSDGNQTSTASQENQNSSDDGAVTIQDNVEDTHNIASCHNPEPKLPESTLPTAHGNVTLQYQNGQREEKERSIEQNVPAPVFEDKENTSNIASHSTSPPLGGTENSSEVHQLLRKEEHSKKTPRELPSPLSNTVNVVYSSSTSTTRVKNQFRKYSSSQSQGMTDLSRNVLKSLLATNVHVADDHRPSYRWLVDSQKTPVIPLSEQGHTHSYNIGLLHSVQQPKTGVKQDNSSTRGSSVPLMLTEHTQLMDSGQGDSVSRISTWKGLPLRHKRTLNFSRNYVQYGNSDLQDIEVEIQPTVQEWCSLNDRTGIEPAVNNPSLKTDTSDDCNEENFQPLLKLGLTDKQPGIPQSRNTKSHNIIECFHTPNFDNKHDCDTGDKIENVCNHGDDSPVINRHKHQMTTNRQPPEDTNGQQPNATNGKITKATHGQQIDTTTRQQSKTTKCQTHQAPIGRTKATNGSQVTTNGQQIETTSNHQPEATNDIEREAAYGDQLETTKRQPVASNGEQPLATNSKTAETKTCQQPEATYCEQMGQTIKGHQSETINRQLPKATNKQQLGLAKRQQPEVTDRLPLEATQGQLSETTKGQQLAQTSRKESEELNKTEQHKIEINMKELVTVKCGQLQTDTSNQIPDIHREMGHLDYKENQRNGKVYAYGNGMYKPGSKTLERYSGSPDKKSSQNRGSKTIKNTNGDTDTTRTSRSVDEYSTTTYVTSITDEYSLKTHIPDDKDLTSNVVVVEEQCGGISVDEDVINRQSIGRTNDVTSNATAICGKNVNQNIETKTDMIGDTKSTECVRDKSSRTDTNCQPYPTQMPEVKYYVGGENDHVKHSSENVMTTISTKKRQNDDISTTDGLKKLETKSNSIPDRPDETPGLSIKQRDDVMYTNLVNKRRELNTNDSGRSNAFSTSKQTSSINDTTMPVNSSVGSTSTYGTKRGTFSTAKRVVINKSFFTKRKVIRTDDILKNDKTTGVLSAELVSDGTTVMSCIDQSNETMENTYNRGDVSQSVIQNPGAMTCTTVDGDDQSGMQQRANANVVTSYDNKEEIVTETKALNQIDPTNRLSVDRKNDSSKSDSGQPKHDTIDLDSKCDADMTRKSSGREVIQGVSATVSMSDSKHSESCSGETIVPNALIHDKPFVESNQVQGQPIQEQTSHVSQMKFLLDSIHDETTIDSDFSEDVSGDYCYHSEPEQDVNLDKDNPPKEKVILLNKRDRLVKPLIKNILNASTGTLPKAVTDEGEIQSENGTLRKGGKASSSMPNIQPTTVHNNNEHHHSIVIKYKKQPYPPEGRPLSASMGSVRFRKIQGAYGQLKKTQSSEDLRGDEETVVKGSGNHGNWTDNSCTPGRGVSTNGDLESPIVNHYDAYSRSGINQKSVSNPHAVMKPSSNVDVVVAKKIMSKRKPVAPPLLRFNSYKADDDMHIPSVLASNKYSADAERLTTDTQGVGRTTDPTEKSHLEADIYRQKDVSSGVNTVGLSPRELAFAQKLSPGERKTMPPSAMEKVRYPEVVSSNTQLPASNFPGPVTSSRETKIDNSYPKAGITPGLVYSTNQRENALRRNLSGSIASGTFLQKALIERKVILPSRYRGRSQKAVSSSPTNQVQYGSSSDPRRRQQLENKLPGSPTNQVQYGSSSDPRRRQQMENKLTGSTDRNSKILPFSKSPDSSRVLPAPKRMMIKRGTLPSARVVNKTAEVAVTSGERPDNDWGAHSISQHSGQQIYPPLGSGTSHATSGDYEHDSLMLNGQYTENEHSDMGGASALLDDGEIIEDYGQELSDLQNALDANVLTKNMSGSKTSSTFLNTALSERRTIFPSRLRSKAHNSTAGIGPPVLASQGSTTGLRYERSSSDSPMQSRNESVTPTENFAIKMDVDYSGINTGTESFEGNTADTTNVKMTGDNSDVQHDDNHLQQTSSAVNSVTLETAVRHVESNTSPEDKINSAASKHIQLPVPKPRETLVPSNFPVNKHRLPIVSNPQRETVATPTKVLTTPRLATPTPRVTVVVDDSIDEREIIKPIIRKPPKEPIQTVPKKIKNFRFRQKMVLTGRLHQKSEENLKFFKQISKTTDKHYKDRTRNVQ